MVHSRNLENPNCEQMTLASTDSKLLLQTANHSPLLQISSRPSTLLGPPASLTSPGTQASAYTSIINRGPHNNLHTNTHQITHACIYVLVQSC